ncbi:MAG: ROK family protein [Rhizomicrobium sp.]
MHDRIDATLTDLGIAPLNSVSAPLSDRSPRTMVQAATEAVTTLMPDPKDRAERLLGIGVAMPGFIDAIRGICLRSDRFGWNDVPIAQMMASAIGKPVWADNDVNAYAIAQTLFGFGRMRRSALVLILGTGVGAALMRDGKIDRGARFMAGEVGFTVEQSGKGGGRTWGELFAEPALEAEWERIVAARGQGGHVDLQAAAAAQDLDALGLLNDRGFRIGQHLAGLINLVDPEVIVVGGEAIRFGPEFVGPMQRAVREFSMVPAPHVDIDWKNDVWTRGAAALVIQSFFDFESVAGTQAGG